jgi:hypothetical protein
METRTAEQMKRLVEEVTPEMRAKAIKVVLDEIESAARRGLHFIQIRDLSSEEYVSLEKLGYRVSEINYKKLKYQITWK